MSKLHLDGQVEAFFAAFAAASDQLDVDRLAELFAETFLAADPAGGATRIPAGVPARPATAGRAVRRRRHHPRRPRRPPAPRAG
jgi:hypothetical protein